MATRSPHRPRDARWWDDFEAEVLVDGLDPDDETQGYDYRDDLARPDECEPLIASQWDERDEARS